MSAPGSIRIAHSCALDPSRAVEQLHAGIAQPDTALVIFFCSGEYDLDALALQINRSFVGIQVIGCTTAGEIGPAGYRTHSLCGASFPASDFVAISGCLGQLQQFETTRGKAFAQNLLQRLEHAGPADFGGHAFALQLIDGMSVREEVVTRSLQDSLGRIPMVGGSAGDGLNFGTTRVFSEGAFHSDSVILALIRTRLPFQTFKTQHFVPTQERAVVTEADAAHRIVTEIDGWPAAEGYARLLHADANDLDPMRFASAPMVVMIDGTNYVRSIQKVNPDGSLTFFCAIEEGLALRLAQGVDLVENLEQALADVRSHIGPPQLVISFDCILRRLEVERLGIEDRVSALFHQNNTIGLNTYGEQFGGVHVNQTLTGVAIGGAGIGPADG
jgi:hypothetical protein